MEDFPDNIKDAINWWVEALLSHRTANRQAILAIDAAAIRIKATEGKYSDILATTLHSQARAECIEFLENEDICSVEERRRAAWVEYLTQQGCKDA